MRRNRPMRDTLMTTFGTQLSPISLEQRLYVLTSDTSVLMDTPLPEYKGTKTLFKKGYLRLRNSLSPSISVMYSKPFSISCVASSTLVAVLQWYSSFSMGSKSWVYRSVVLMSLCPSRTLTCSRSLVLWYYIVA